MAGHANAQAARFAEAVTNHPATSLEYPVQANEVFVKWNKEGFEQIQAHDIKFLIWPGRDDLARFVFGHSTSEEETIYLINILNDSN